MYSFIDFDSPIRSAIVLYFFLLVVLFFFRPRLLEYNDEKGKCALPIVILIVSIISYYIFAVISSFRS